MASAVLKQRNTCAESHVFTSLKPFYGFGCIETQLRILRIPVEMNLINPSMASAVLKPFG